MFEVWMSASAIPSFLSAAMMSVIAWAPASRAALTVALVAVIPRLMRATSGTTVTLPVADTVMVCGAGVVSPGAPLAGVARTESAAIATTSAPSDAAPTVFRVWLVVMGVRLHLALPPGSGAVVRRRRWYVPRGSLGSGSRTRNGPDGVEAERFAALV